MFCLYILEVDYLLVVSIYILDCIYIEEIKYLLVISIIVEVLQVRKDLLFFIYIVSLFQFFFTVLFLAYFFTPFTFAFFVEVLELLRFDDFFVSRKVHRSNKNITFTPK